MDARGRPERRLSAAIGLGSNVGDRLAMLRGAVIGLRELGELTRLSAVYETDAVGPAQAAFLNAAVLLDTTLEPLALLDALLAIERGLGRERRERWGPRTIDLDVLWIDGVAVDDARLSVPHPQLTERAFAMQTLLDVAPGARDPRSGEELRLAPHASAQGVRAIDAALVQVAAVG